MGAGRDAGSGAKRLGKALAIRTTLISALGQPLCHPNFGLSFSQIVVLGLFPNG